MPNTQQDLLTDHRHQSEPDLDNATRPTGAPDKPHPPDTDTRSAAAPSGDWGREAELPEQPHNGYQQELFPRVPAKRT